MFNFYLFSQSYEGAEISSIEENLQNLNDLVINEREETDSFLMHESLWETSTANGNFADVIFSQLTDKQFIDTVLPKLFQAIIPINIKLNSFEEFDNLYKLYNAFYGICFENLDLSRCLNSKDAYREFRTRNLWEITPDTFWERKDLLFHKLAFCDSVKEDISIIGRTYLSQIIAKLKELDTYILSYWKQGEFNYVDANSKCSLNMSPESKKTMEQEKFYNQRVFSLPDGTKRCFDLHIKTGNVRIHIYPENGYAYIGYIGKHLETFKFH